MRSNASASSSSRAWAVLRWCRTGTVPSEEEVTSRLPTEPEL
ncbi:hypothetical protein ACFQ6N_33295 [Kitasatospora sp. NPDC056446]